MVLGEIVGATGHRGALRVRWLGDGPDNLRRASRVALASGGEAGRERAAERWHEVRCAEPDRREELRIELVGVESREAAEALTGLLVIGDASQLETLPPGEHYWFEWIGCCVSSADGRRLGTVKEIWDAGAHDVLVVEEEESRRQLLLPVARELLREVDLDARRIVMEVPAGLEQPSNP